MPSECDDMSDPFQGGGLLGSFLKAEFFELSSLPSPLWPMKGVSFFFFFCFYFSWRITALQYCFGLCHTSTWISHRYIYAPPSWTSHPSRLSQRTGFELPASYGKFPLAVYFTYGNIYVSMLLSQLILPSPSPSVSTSLISMSAFPLLPCK